VGDRHEIWRRVAFDFKQAEPMAPTGYEAFVEVFIRERAEPLEPNFVETHRAPDDPWVRFQILGRDTGAEHADPRTTWVHVHEGLIERIEVRFRRSGAFATGFSYAEEPDEPAAE
jgi:hypothetical protein